MIPKIITVVVLKMEAFGFYIAVMHSKEAEFMVNRVDPDQTAPKESDLGLLC